MAIVKPRRVAPDAADRVQPSQTTTTWRRRRGLRFTFRFYLAVRLVNSGRMKKVLFMAVLAVGVVFEAVADDLEPLPLVLPPPAMKGTPQALPTNTTARFSSGVSVYEFLKRSSVVRYDQAGLAKDAPAITSLATAEHLDAHAASVAIRIAQQSK